MSQPTRRTPPVRRAGLARLVEMLVASALTAVLAVTVAGPAAAAGGTGPDSATFEVQFMTGMIDHHQMAVDMGEVCKDRAVHDELQELCRNIVKSQSREIRMMQSWLRDWYDRTHEPQTDAHHEQMLEHLRSLHGHQFEIAFMQMMIPHHRQAVREGLECVRKATHEPLVQLCKDIVVTQSLEIEDMQGWLCSWYGKCEDQAHEHNQGEPGHDQGEHHCEHCGGGQHNGTQHAA